MEAYRRTVENKKDEAKLQVGSSDHNIAKTYHTRAVIHMGPDKTGTSSIQTASKKYEKELRLDGYEMPWSIKNEEDQKIDGIDFTTCFLDPSIMKSTECDVNQLLAGLDTSSRRRNLFVSSEAFSRIGVGNSNIERFRAYLKAWDEVTVFVYYRHYFSWLLSSYNQRTKTFFQKASYQTVSAFFEQITEYPPWDIYTAMLVERIKPVFKDIVVVNMHDKSKGSPAESLFCYGMKDTTHTCEAIRKNNDIHSNSSRDLDSIHLINAATKVGLLGTIEDKERQKQIESDVESMINRLKLEGVEVKKKCLSSEILEKIWDISVHYKRILFPDAQKLDDASLDEKNMRNDFEKLAKKAFCMVDVDDVLSQKIWKDFFHSLEPRIEN